MDLLASTGAPLLLVNLVFAAIALAIGFAAGAWVSGGTAESVPEASDTGPDESADLERQLVAERTLLASDRLRDLAASVASDVGSHNASIEQIENRLQNGKGKDADAVLTAISEISHANDALTAKLAKAEEQIQSQAQQIRTHESEARTDSLTSLSNRRAFDDELKRRYAEWERKGTPLSLIILDVDHFKKFNDTHGHQAGDEVLRRVGRTITECARDMDLPCRYGGEEFAVIMPATESDSGGVLAERVRSQIESTTVEFEGKELSVTASFGLAGVAPGDNVAAIIKRADEALYASKDAGRNNAHWHNGSECVPITPGTASKTEGIDAATEHTANSVLDGLPNRTRFVEILRTEVRASQDAGTPLALLTADFEAYGQLEEEFGQAVARLTLDSIAQFLDNAIQEIDCLARLSGGSFILMMPRRTAEDANRLGDRINTALANCAIPLGDSQLHLGTTMAVTELEAADTPATLMERAETQLRRTPEAV